MELIVQYMDDLEDLFYAFALKWERIRRAVHFALFVLVAFLLQIFLINLAFSYPPFAVGIAAILSVVVMYRGATRSNFDHLSSF